MVVVVTYVFPEGVEMVLYPTDGGCKNFFLLPTIFSSSTVVVHLVGKQEVLVWVLLVELISTIYLSSFHSYVCTHFCLAGTYTLIQLMWRWYPSDGRDYNNVQIWCSCSQSTLLPWSLSLYHLLSNSFLPPSHHLHLIYPLVYQLLFFLLSLISGLFGMPKINNNKSHITAESCS